jgi:hypothetical protein
VPADLDGVCAQRPQRSAVGAEEGLRRGRTEEVSKKAGPGAASAAIAARFERGLFVEEIELGGVVFRFWCKGLVVTADLREVVGLKLQSEVHQRVGDISGDLIGDGELL